MICNDQTVYGKALGAFLLLLALMGTPSFAQKSVQNPARELLRYGELAYAEAIRVPSDKPGSAQVDVLLRVSYDFLVFTRTGKFMADSTFSAALEVAIDVRKLPDVYIASENHRSEVFANEYETTNTRDKFILLRKTFYADTGRYVFDIELNDGSSTRTKSFKLPVTIKGHFSDDGLTVGSIVPISHEAGGASVLGYGGRLLFAQPAVFAVTGAGVDGAEWELRVDRVLGERKTPVFSMPLVPTAILHGQAIVHGAGIVPDFALAPNEGSVGVWVVFKPSLDTLPVGTYTFTLSYSNASMRDSVTQTVPVFWQEMPISLYDPTFAAEHMRYILTEDELDEMTSGNDEQKKQKIEAWWKKNDPTPATPYNEHMFEYFRRVDEAYFRFQTTRFVNGALTDRGKVFILYGEPEHIERDLKSGGPPEEIWKYPSLDKTFRFNDRERNGTYRLVN